VQNVSAIEILKGVFIILFTRKKRKLVLFFLLQKISLAQLWFMSGVENQIIIHSKELIINRVDSSFSLRLEIPPNLFTV
jgi:hypothetical protein